MSSFAKSTFILGALCLGLLAVAGLAGELLQGVPGMLVQGACLVVGALLMMPLAGGMLVLHRERRRQRGMPDLFWQLAQRRREFALDQPGGFRGGPLRRILSRALLGHGLLPGDVVEIRSLTEILTTLDAKGTLHGMPFQPEMIPFCGSRVRVFRVLDKIYDYGRTRRMRWLKGCVLLNHLRCDGAAHGGCQAACYLIWRSEWLRQISGASVGTCEAASREARQVPPVIAEGVRSGAANRCQFTELHGCSQEFGAQSWRKDLVPLIGGNYSISAWLVALLTRCFNAAQALRGGEGYPAMPGVGGHLSPDAAPLSPGARVIVRSRDEIAKTLSRSGKNRGLWFDRDMIKHCGREFRVQSRVERIIDDSNGQMRQMKSPCITLEGVDYSGEGLHFNAQHDPTFWRECWLKPAVKEDAEPPGK